jgi:predicted DNA-binding transcriptional regulator YafY
MRADRLLSFLMLLQSRGTLTARHLARELEVSERTIYRDIEALSMSGVPIYAERGPGGGCSLLESYRTTLTGLNNNEMRALFMLNVPAPLTQLGVSSDLKGALLKLSAGLSAASRKEEERTRQRIFLDARWWFQADEALAFLATLQQAVWRDLRLRLRYRSEFETVVEQVVDPYGLVAKANVWYLVYSWEETRQALRASRIINATILEESFQRPVDFDLETFWQQWCANFEESRPVYRVTARISPDLIPFLGRYFGDQARAILAEASQPDEKGWLTIGLSFERFENARERLLGLGRAIEVLEPEALRKSIIDFAGQISSFYRESSLVLKSS